MDRATLIVSRTSDADLKIRGIEILIDGEFIGELTFGRALEIEISPGPHALKATNKLKSKTVQFDAAEGERVSFQVIGITLFGLWTVMTMLGTVAYRIELVRDNY
jgi:hypothetical protein